MYPKAEKKFERDDFNVLYDYLWRDKSMAEHCARNGRNKADRAAAAAKVQAYDHVLKIMEVIEKSNLTFKDGEILRDGQVIR